MVSQDPTGPVEAKHKESREGLRKTLHTVVTPFQTERRTTDIPRWLAGAAPTPTNDGWTVRCGEPMALKSRAVAGDNGFVKLRFVAP